MTLVPAAIARAASRLEPPLASLGDCSRAAPPASRQRCDRRDQLAQVALTANLHDPDHVRIVCGTLGGLTRGFAELVRSGQATARPALNRYARNCDLRRRVRQWSMESGNRTAHPQPASSSPL